MRKAYVISGGIVAIVVIGAIIGIVAMTRQNAAPATENTDQTSESDKAPANSSESAIYRQYAALKGEEYDKAFVSNMIVHHEGAVNMAELAMARASHQEIKDLATAIVTSQSKEIADMHQWQQDWGYPASSGHSMHGGSDSMQQDMAVMGADLQELSGDTFDKKFLQLMIEHHQQAIDMATPAETNAKHQEVKDLARMIIAAQTTEITNMKQWQQDWHYTD